MRHGGEIDHERGGPKIVNRGVSGLRAGGQHRFLKRGDGKLPIRLTERDQSNSGGHQIGDITLQEGGQGQAQPECPALPSELQERRLSAG